MKTDRLPAVLIDFWLACTLLSRLPLPHLPELAFSGGARAVWAYPLAGVLLGVVAGYLGLALFAMGLPPMYASGVTLGVLMLTTGAMHEDGLADTADGFWGGFDPARRLEIMKDSAIGTYGVLALILVTGLRWIAYAALLPLGVLPIIAVAALSRSAMPLVMAGLPHARASGLSHSVGRPAAKYCVFGSGGALLIATAALGLPLAITCALVVLGMAFAIGWCAKAKICGQTGDVLGATQQLSEVAVLGVLLVALT